MSSAIITSDDELNKIFTKDIIKYYKENKNEITSELLETIRSFGNKGKQLALDLLDFEKDSEQYYLDSFSNRMSFNGNRRLKKPFAKLGLYPIHIEELERCSNDIHYYKDNYVKIRTKSGVNFPEVRQYQNDFIELLSGEDEGIIGLMGRQSSKSISTSIYLTHLIIFDTEKNIGIVANKGSLAREFLSNVKNIFIELPVWMQVGVKAWNKSFVEFENDMRVLTDVPSQDSFRGFSIHCAIIDECAFVRSSVWEEFIDAFLPSQAALSWKKNIILSTAKGMNHFYNLVKGASPDFSTDGSGIKEPGPASNGYKLFKVDWRDVPRYNSKGELIEPETFKNNIIKKHGVLYWNQNFASEFLGSSSTLISSEKLSSFNIKEPIKILDNKLRIYDLPEKGHKYILAVDPSKDGIDAFAVQVIDVTDLKFKQVASADIQIDYLLMPEFIVEWCEYYNYAFLIIENNEGAGQSIADTIHKTYEYENMFFDVKTESSGASKIRKKYPGFRTTTKSRKLILNTMRLFIENDNLDIVDKKTINEFFTFILINNKYQADDSCHDDMIMSLAIVFAPFCSTKNFSDMKLLISKLYNKDEDNSESVDLSDIFVIGDFDDGVEFEETEYKSVQYFGGYIIEDETFE